MPARTFGLLETSVSLRGRGLEAIALDIFIGNAPDGSSGSGEEQFLDGDSGNIDSKKIRDVVIALNEAGVQEEKNQKQSKIQSGETERADEHGGNQVGAEKGNHNSANGKGDDGVVDGLARMPELKREKNHDDDNERGEVPSTRGLSDHGKPFFKKNLCYHRSDASPGSRH